MTREQFLSAAGALYDMLANGGVAPGAAPSGGSGDGRAPRFDTKIQRKGGMVQYASETDLEGLIYWKSRADEPPSDPKYAESNAKQSKALSYWISYRQANPTAVWSGERNREHITAKPPSSKPETYLKDEIQRAVAATPGFSDHGDAWEDPQASSDLDDTF